LFTIASMAAVEKPPLMFMFVSAADITVLLDLSVYQLVVNDTLPVTSQSLPVFGRSAVNYMMIKFVVIVYVVAKATYIRLLLWQKWGFSALAP